MPTPNWGPQAGVPMDDATFNAYVSANPPGQDVNGVFWGGAVPQSGVNSSQTQPGSYAPYDWWHNALMGREMPGSVGFDTRNQDQARAEQQRVIQALQAQAAGDPNSMAQQQLSNSYADAKSQQSSLGSTMRGQSAGAAMRGIQAGQQGIQRGYAGDQKMLMLQEQQAAQAMLAQLLAQQQGQDISQAQGLANNALGNSQLSDAAKQFYLGMAGDMDMAATERSNQIARAQLGFTDQQNAITQGLLRSMGNAASTGLATYGSMANSGGGGTTFRQVDGQNSIVPSWDK